MILSAPAPTSWFGDISGRYTGSCKPDKHYRVLPAGLREERYACRTKHHLVARLPLRLFATSSTQTLSRCCRRQFPPAIIVLRLCFLVLPFPFSPVSMHG